MRTRDLSQEIKRRTELEQEVMEISTRTMERIGQELHDDLCQYLLGISLLASSARQQLENNQEPQKESLGKISEHLSEAIAKIKTISRGLMPMELEPPHSFLERLEALVGDNLRLVAIDIDVNVDPGFSIPDRTRELNIFRIVQEALTNAIKHSKAKHIEISSAKKIDPPQGMSVLSLEVRDDGTGLPPEHIQGGEGGLA